MEKDCVAIFVKDFRMMNLLVEQIHSCSNVPEKFILLDIGDKLKLNKAFCGLSDYDSIYLFSSNVIIDKLFFDRMRSVVSLEKVGSIFCPDIVNDKSIIDCSSILSLSKMSRSESRMCFVKGDIIAKIPHIPEQLNYEWYVEWLWYWSVRLGCNWFKVNGINIFSSNGVPGIKKLKEESELFYNLIEQREDKREYCV